ncbi:MAG: gamma-glutamyltransferase family protein [Pseudomonadota bacterium]
MTGRSNPLLAPILSLALALGAPKAIAQDADAGRATPEAATGRTAQALTTANEYMIVAANPLAAQAGAAAMAEGGSAADAAIVSLLVLNVVEPQSSGLGGGAFALVHGPDGLTSFDARETAPMRAGPDLFLEDGAPIGWREGVASGRSVGVPGLGRLLEVLHARHGRLDWPRLVAPALALARDGFPMSPRLAGMLQGMAPRLAGTDAAAVFLDAGAPRPPGTVLRQPDLAATLEAIGREGPEVLYRAPIATEIVAATQTPPRPGQLTVMDFARYEVIERAPVCHDFRAIWRVCGMGPPSSGATTVGQILGLVGGQPPAEDPVARAHLFAEASRLAYADRARYLGDPDQVAVPVAGLLDPEYLAARGALIDAGRASSGPAEPGTPPGVADQPGPDASASSPGTTHLSVIDAEGLAISLTASIETAFGSARMAAGMLLNNQLTDFSFNPGPAEAPAANAPGAGKRPRSSMAPTIAYRLDAPDRPAILIGSPGGSRIPEYVAGALLLMLERGADAAAAAAVAHVSHRNRDVLVLEQDAHDPALAGALSALGHETALADMTSGLHIIAVAPDGSLSGGADPRREGLATGE